MRGTLSVDGRRAAAAAVVLAMAVLTVALWITRTKPGDGNIANDAVLTASSVARGSVIRDVTNSLRNTDPHRGWRTADETTGAWIEFSWSSPQRLRRIALVRNPLDEAGITSGYLVFGDGSQLQVRLSTTSRETVLPFTPRSVQTLRFVVSTVSPGATSVLLSRVRIYTRSHSGDVATDSESQGDSATTASPSATRGSAATLGRLVDGRLDTVWRVSAPAGTSVVLRWKQPRELKSVSIAGAPSSALLRSATLTFSDGTRLMLGAVNTDADHPTTISFMPKVTSSLRLRIDAVSGKGALSLAELSAYQLDAPPRIPVGTSSARSYRAPPSCNASAPRPGQDIGIVARCPIDGAPVADAVNLELTVAERYTSVRTQVTPPDSATPSAPPINSTPSAAGTITVPLNLQALPAGPFGVVVTATGPGLPDKLVTLHLDKQTGTARPTSSALTPRNGPAKGRSLVFDDEFSREPDIAQLGRNADYASSKPGVSGVQDFGEAIFAPPSAHLGNARVVDNSYLKLSVQPSLHYPDPAGYGRNHIGALVSSAGVGGTGFSAQYGYFETRMLAPAAPGTWPAFWMLPSDNLVLPQQAVAEIDAVELYGQMPTGACSTTHEYEGGHDGGVARCGTRWSSASQAARWHTYGVSIEPSTVRFYIDGKLVATAPPVQGGSQPMFFLLNLALGGGWPVQLGSTSGLASLYIDYVRVYV